MVMRRTMAEAVNGVNARRIGERGREPRDEVRRGRGGGLGREGFMTAGRGRVGAARRFYASVRSRSSGIDGCRGGRRAARTLRWFPVRWGEARVR